LAIAAGECAKKEKEDPQLNLSVSNNEVALTLTLSMCGGMWKPVYKVVLIPVALSKVDILQAQLRDAQEQIQELSRKVARGLMKLHSQTACPTGSCISWDSSDRSVLPQDYYSLSDDKRTITVLVAGFYHVSVRVGHQTQPCGNVSGFSLLVNGNVECSGPNFVQEVFSLNARDSLTVMYVGLIPTNPDQLSNCFSIVRM
jgi:hypothetical protein